MPLDNKPEPISSDPDPRWAHKTIGAFSDLTSAAAWFALFGWPEPPNSGGGSGQDQDQDSEENEDDSEARDAGESGDAEGQEVGPEEGEESDEDSDSEAGSDPDDGDLPNGDEFDPDSESETDSEEDLDSQCIPTESESESERESEAKISGGTGPDPDDWSWTYSERNSTCVHREFDSWSNFVKCVLDQSLRTWKKENCTSHERKDESWFGTKTFDEAVTMAVSTGWPEGRKLLTDSFARVSPRPTYYPTIEFSVAGGYPIVPVYCSGDPSCMAVDPGADHRTSKPIVRIDYNHWISAYVTVNDMMLRGAAVLSLASRLEAQGISTELRIIGNTRSGSKTWRYSIVYKKAGEYLDIDRAAFAIAHPASMRRLAFALLEQTKELESDLKGWYGIPVHDRNDTNPNTIFVPGSKGSETPESANLAVEVAAESLLKSLRMERQTP
jgi:hypothetical protein